MSNLVNNAVTAIQNWNTVRNDSAVTIPIFNNGAYFEITQSMYSTWKDIFSKNKIASDKQKIHAYLGLSIPNATGVFALYALDSYTDGLLVESNLSSFNESIQLINYEPAVLPNVVFNNEKLSTTGINPLTALKQSTQWALHKNAWLQQQSNMTQVLDIPFGDLQKLFNTHKAESLICQLAFKAMKAGSTKLQLDLIIWGHSATQGILGKYPQDLIMPKPPYSLIKEDFQLLKYAL